MLSLNLPFANRDAGAANTGGCDDKNQRENIKINKVEIDRLTIISSRPFEMVKLKAAVGQPDIIEFQEIHLARADVC